MAYRICALACLAFLVRPAVAQERVHPETLSERTGASVSYWRTSLSAAGDALVERDAAHFAGQRAHWEHAINQRLQAVAK